MNYAQYLAKGKTIESTESLIEKVINSQGLDENALQELVNRAQSQDSKAIEFLLMLQQQSEVSKFEKPSGPIVKKDQQDPNMPVAVETGTVDGRKYTYMPYQGEGRGPIDRFEYIGQDGNTYGMTIQGPDTTYVMNGQQYNDPEGQRVIKERRAAVVREKCGGSVKKKETGDKITRKKVMAKGGCPCMIKKVGGRLIEVDSCTGLPVHKSGGMVKKFASPDGPVQRISGNDIKGTYLHRDGRNRHYKIHNGNLYSADTPLIGNSITSMSLTGWDQMTPEIARGMGLIRGTMGNKSIYFQLNKDTGLYNAYGDGVNPNAVYGRHVGADGKARYYSNYGATDATWDANTGSWTREGYTYNPQSGGWTQNSPEADPAAAPALAAAPEPVAPKQTDAEAIEAYIASLSPSQLLYARRIQQNKGEFTADELAGLDAETQGLLNPNDKLRLLKIQRALAQNAEALTLSLTFNGQTYVDKDAYNSAVNTYNTGLGTNRNSTINTAVGAAFGKDSRHAQAAASALADAQAFAGSKTMDKRAFKQYMRNNETGGARFRNRAWKAYQALDLNAMQAKQAEQYKDPKLIDYSQYKTGGQLNYRHYFQ